MSEQRKRIENYQQLKIWIQEAKKKSGKNQKELCELAERFTFVDSKGTSHKLNESDFSKLPRKAPTKNEGMYNLYSMLGLLYLVKVLSTEEEVENFLKSCGLENNVPEQTTWEEIWQFIEQQTQIVEETKEPSAILRKGIERRGGIRSWRKRRFQIVAVIAAISLFLFIIVVVAALTLNSQETYSTFSKNCTLAKNYTQPRPPQEYDFNFFSADDSDGAILSNDVRTLGQNAYGVWVGYIATSENGNDYVSYHYHDENHHGYWVHCSGLNLLHKQNVNDFAFTGDSVWIAIDATNEHPESPGVARLTKTGWQFYGTAHGLPSNIVYNLYIDKTGTLWATTFNGAAKFNGEIWQPFYEISTEKTDALPCGEVHQLRDDEQQTRWFALVRCGVTFIARGQWYSRFNTGNDPRRNARAIEVDDQNGVWIATAGGGLLRYDGQTWFEFMPPAIPSADVRDVKRDIYGRIWIATDKGVVYSDDLGKTWKQYSHLPTWKIVFGCDRCLYTPNSVWFVIDYQGLGYIRIPPRLPTVQVISTPVPVILKPGEEYPFAVKVRVIGEHLTPASEEGDSLRSVDPPSTDLFGTYPLIGVTKAVEVGQEYVFQSTQPIIAPDEPGIYRLSWKVWQGGRFVTDPIMIEFEVSNP